MSNNLKTSTNEELIKLISDAADELEWRRKANEVASGQNSTTEGETDEGGDHPPVSKFP